jgi:hypothetical protein
MNRKQSVVLMQNDSEAETFRRYGEVFRKNLTTFRSLAVDEGLRGCWPDAHPCVRNVVVAQHATHT